MNEAKYHSTLVIRVTKEQREVIESLSAKRGISLGEAGRLLLNLAILEAAQNGLLDHTEESDYEHYLRIHETTH